MLPRVDARRRFALTLRWRCRATPSSDPARRLRGALLAQHDVPVLEVARSKEARDREEEELENPPHRLVVACSERRPGRLEVLVPCAQRLRVRGAEVAPTRP